MSERPKQSIEAASMVDYMHQSDRRISHYHEDLTKIHPAVEAVVETDTSSEDFGRIKDVDLADRMASRHNDVFDSDAEFINRTRASGHDAAEKEKTHNMAGQYAEELAKHAIKRKALANGATEDEAEKAVDDYKITQGDEWASHSREAAIYSDMRSQMDNPFVATGETIYRIKDAMKRRRAKREAKKSE